ncbi:cytochrome c biogenesis protein CCS1, chloroplastic [Tanacetum coccineum]|uniref:Cytochrome c biogenesis protein CCS1, chloroplastic n=1 Tax=Tanacetum coccineum TaxID=301880 RepID=A0ABQ5A952_9ASTR
MKRIRIFSSKDVEQPVGSITQTAAGSTTQAASRSASVGQASQQAPKKKVRGPTKKKATWNLKSHEKVVVTFNELAQPIGDEANELTKFLGTLVRMSQHIGIEYEEWRKVPEIKKEDLWSIVKEKFIFEPSETTEIKDWIMTDMSTKWKTWKHELKKSSYDSSLTVDEIVALQTDDRVDIGQFRTLVTSWFTEKKQVEAENKKRNRSKSDEPHITGSKSFARLCDEETQKNDGVPPSRGGMYCLTRTYQDGRVVNAKAGKVVEAIKTMGESGTAQETRTDGSPFWIDDDLAKVKGPERGGNIRCVGKFPAAKKRRVQDPQVPLLKAEVKGLRKDFMSLVAAVKEHIPGLNLSTLISRANTNMEGDDACNVPDNGLAHNPKNPRSAGASHHPKNSTSTATSAHPKNSRSTATSPHPKNPTSGTRPKNPTSGPSRQCYSYYR